MNQVVTKGSYACVNIGGCEILGVCRRLELPLEQKIFTFCVPLDTWDKALYQLQGG